jgi:hypothetical protein
MPLSPPVLNGTQRYVFREANKWPSPPELRVTRAAPERGAIRNSGNASTRSKPVDLQRRMATARLRYFAIGFALHLYERHESGGTSNRVSAYANDRAF